MIAALGFLLFAASTSGVQAAVLIQQQAGVFAFEADHYDSLARASGSLDWQRITTTTGIKLLPANTNAKGGAAMLQPSGSSDNLFMTYRLQFTHDGNYYLYTRYANFDMNNDGGYGNEDSFFLPSSFGAAANTSGVWHEQFLSTVHSKDGVKFVFDQANKMKTDNDNRVSDGFLMYQISGASVESPVEVTFTIRSRENGTALDQFIFTTTPYTLSSDTHATLDAIQSVPEPSKSLLALCGLVALVRHRQRPN